MMQIRNTVRENPLVSMVIGHEDYVRAMTDDGRAWVAQVHGAVVGFSCGRHVQGDIWALFVREDHESRGIGRALLHHATAWLFGRGVSPIRLSTGADTRAERVYRALGWRDVGRTASGEIEFVYERR